MRECTGNQTIAFGGAAAPRVVLSLTSFPDRIGTLAEVLEPIFQQTVPPDLVVLWLAESQFPDGEGALPEELLSLRARGLHIRWCQDLGPHKKYFYTMQQYPDDIVITIDDDLVYRRDLVEVLLRSYARFPSAVSALRVHRLRFGLDGELLPYADRVVEDETALDRPSMSLIATGVSGVLYPPHCMHSELFNLEKIIETCPHADDLWLKVMQTMVGTPTVLADAHTRLEHVGNTQDTALWGTNVLNNDAQMERILGEYDTFFGDDDTLLSRMNPLGCTPKISVVIPVFNVGEHLGGALDSILAQSYRNFEVICVNDSSTDDCLSILEDYAARDPRLKIITVENGGPGNARNVGVDACAGDYVVFCDGDDLLPANSFEVRVRRAVETDADVVIGCFVQIQEGGRTIKSPALSDLRDDFWKIYATSAVVWNKLIRTDFIRKNDLRFPSMRQGEDRVFIADLYVHHPRIVAIPDVVYCWMRRASAGQKSLSYRFTEDDFCERMQSWLASYELFREHGVSQANQLLFKWAPYIKSLLDDYLRSIQDGGGRAFAMVQRLMAMADWRLASSRFRKTWKMDYATFAALSVDEYRAASRSGLDRERGPLSWTGDAPLDSGTGPRATRAVVIVSDNAYAMPVGVLLTSLRQHKAPLTSYAVYIVSNGISDENKARLLSLGESGFEISFIEASEGRALEDFSGTTVISELPASVSALQKFHIPQMLDQYDKALYLDCDLLILDDLEPLFDIDISEHYVAAGKDSLEFLKPPHFARLQCNNKTYFNSGVMLLNLTKMREDNVTESLLDYRQNGINYFMDQDAFNVVFNDNIVVLPFYYNMDLTALRKFSKQQLMDHYHVYGFQNRAALYRRAKILHFAGFSKPWIYDIPYFTEIYSRYYDLSPFSDIPLQLKPNQYPMPPQNEKSDAEKVAALTREVKKLKTDLRKAQKKAARLRNSASYRIGRALTWLPRTARNSLWSLRKLLVGH